MGAVVALALLLVLPALASIRVAQMLDPRFIAGYWIFFLGLTFSLYWRDKRRAEAGAWRIPESALHLSELLGGWPAAYVAQRLYRHKIAKTSYQVSFWAIVILHEAATFDFLQDWHYLRSGLAIAQGLIARGL
jgi:uncharacterized membrane protein YsdA (DUF1294 family)